MTVRFSQNETSEANKEHDLLSHNETETCRDIANDCIPNHININKCEPILFSKSRNYPCCNTGKDNTVKKVPCNNNNKKHGDEIADETFTKKSNLDHKSSKIMYCRLKPCESDLVNVYTANN